MKPHPNRKKHEKKQSFADTYMELAHLLKADPKLKEKEPMQMGQEMIGIFEDGNFTDAFQDLKDKKREVLTLAVEDISKGVNTLMSSSIGLVYKHNKILNYISPHGSLPSGTIIYSINWKDVKAFQKWRKGETVEIPQEQLNAAIYFLTVQLSETL